MNQLKSSYNCPFKDSHSHPIHTCFTTTASNVVQINTCLHVINKVKTKLWKPYSCFLKTFSLNKSCVVQTETTRVFCMTTYGLLDYLLLSIVKSYWMLQLWEANWVRRLARGNPIPALQQQDRDLQRAMEIAYPLTNRTNPPADDRPLQPDQGKYLFKISRGKWLLKADQG